MRGIDISNWQAGLDLSKVAKSLDFAIFKVSEGTGFVDKYAKNWLRQARSLGLLTGVYHYGNKKDPVAEADFFLKTAKDEIGRSILVLDYEEGQGGAWAKKFVDRVHAKTGLWPMVYCSASVCRDFNGTDVASHCPLWMAGYPKDYSTWPPSNAYPYSTAPWKSADIWQFTSGLRLDGWNGRLDGDIAYIDKRRWEQIATGKTAPKVKTEDEIREAASACLLGKYGNGAARVARLKAAGYDPTVVQSLIDDILTKEAAYFEAANKVIVGDFGTGNDRVKNIRAAGFDPDIVQSIVNMEWSIKL